MRVLYFCIHLHHCRVFCTRTTVTMIPRMKRGRVVLGSRIVRKTQYAPLSYVTRKRGRPYDDGLDDVPIMALPLEIWLRIISFVPVRERLATLALVHPTLCYYVHFALKSIAIVAHPHPTDFACFARRCERSTLYAIELQNIAITKTLAAFIKERAPHTVTMLYNSMTAHQVKLTLKNQPQSVTLVFVFNSRDHLHKAFVCPLYIDTLCVKHGEISWAGGYIFLGTCSAPLSIDRLNFCWEAGKLQPIEWIDSDFIVKHTGRLKTIDIRRGPEMCTIHNGEAGDCFGAMKWILCENNFLTHVSMCDRCIQMAADATLEVNLTRYSNLISPFLIVYDCLPQLRPTAITFNLPAPTLSVDEFNVGDVPAAYVAEFNDDDNVRFCTALEFCKFCTDVSIRITADQLSPAQRDALHTFVATVRRVQSATMPRKLTVYIPNELPHVCVHNLDL